jgi:hypothetical protein
MTTTNQEIGCISKVDFGHDHQLQLWIMPLGQKDWKWTLYIAYVPGGRQVRRAEEASGSNVDYAEARRLGQEAYENFITNESVRSGSPSAASATAPSTVS